jgi:hypothetical protein
VELVETRDLQGGVTVEIYLILALEKKKSIKLFPV